MDTIMTRTIQKKAKKQMRRRQALTRVVLGLGLIVCLSLTVLSVYRYAQIADLNRELVSLQEVIQKKTADRDWLLNELEPYTNRAAIEPKAKQWLAMQPSAAEPVHANIETKKDVVTIRPTEDETRGTLLAELSAMVVSFLFH